MVNMYRAWSETLSISFSTRSSGTPGQSPILVLTGNATGQLAITLTAGVPQVTLNGEPLTLPAGLVVSGYDATAVTGVNLQAADDASSSSLTGAVGYDTLAGGAGNDTFTVGMGGWDEIDGGAGIDTVILNRNVWNSAHGVRLGIGLQPDGSADSVTLYYTTPDGQPSQVQLLNVEQMRFNDVSGTIDLGSGLDDDINVVQGVLSVLSGGAGNDRISGNGWLLGGSGNDTLTGGGGNDTLVGGTGNDVLVGNSSDDTAMVFAVSASSAVSVTVTDDAIIDSRGDTDSLTGIEKVFISGSSHNDTLTGSARDETLSGSAGDDLISGGGGNDLLSGGVGNDTLTGGDGQDLFQLTAGDQLVYRDHITDFTGGDRLRVLGTDGAAMALTGVSAGTGGTVLAGQVQYETVVGGLRLHIGLDALAGADLTVDLAGPVDGAALVLSGGDIRHEGPMSLTGGVGGDTLIGGPGDDTISGGGGLDSLSGEAGDDLLIVGSGSGTVTGGDGNDVFRFERTPTDDIYWISATITDLKPGDSIVLSDYQIDKLRVGDYQDMPMGVPSFRLQQDFDGSTVLIAQTRQTPSGGIQATQRDSIKLGTNIALDGFELVGENTLVYHGTGAPGTVTGGANDDLLIGGSGPDSIMGGAGRDTLKGGTGDDTLWGGDGDDVLYGGSGRNTFHGGAGTDLVVIDALLADMVFTQQNGGMLVADRNASGGGIHQLFDVEVVVLRDQVITLSSPYPHPPLVHPVFFDESWYLSQNPDVAQAVRAGVVPNGQVHYLLSGYAEGRQPAKGFIDTSLPFDEAAYLARNPDVAAAVRAGTFSSGLAHYAVYGYRESSRIDNTSPPASTKPYSEDFYLYDNPDVASAVAQGVYANGYAHYILYGRAEGRLTFPPAANEPYGLKDFGYDETYYLATNPDVAAAVTDGRYRNGYEHFFLQGLKEGRDPNPYFDADWYGAHNQDVVAAVSQGQFGSLLEHFTRFGWREGRDPSGQFDISRYLEDHPDVAAANVNPVLHYMISGWGEGRIVRASDDYFG